MIYDVFKKAATKEIIVREDGGATPAGFIAFGTFTDVDDDPDVMFHYVRDLLFAAGEINPSSWTIERLALSITVLPATKTVDLSSDPTHQIHTTFDPLFPADMALTYVSSDPTKATVSASGLVTGLVAGSTTITVTHTASGKTDTCVVTVQA